MWALSAARAAKYVVPLAVAIGLVSLLLFSITVQRDYGTPVL